MEISIIILTYNSSKYINNLLVSLIKKYKKELGENKLEIIVADNASTDDTLLLASKFEEIKTVDNKGNWGFAKGNNLASKSASGKYILFVNPDAEFYKGDIFEMSKVFKDEKTAIVGGKIVAWDKKNENSAGKFYTPLNLLFLIMGIDDFMGVRFSPDKDREVDYVSGGFMMVKKDKFEKLNGFDDNIFMYIEDMELCYRAKLNGDKVMFSPKAILKHQGQGSSNKTFAIVNIYKGIVYFYKKHMNQYSGLVKLMLKTKAGALVILGKIVNNQYLSKTYSEAFKEV